MTFLERELGEDGIGVGEMFNSLLFESTTVSYAPSE